MDKTNLLSGKEQRVSLQRDEGRHGPRLEGRTLPRHRTTHPGAARHLCCGRRVVSNSMPSRPTVLASRDTRATVDVNGETHGRRPPPPSNWEGCDIPTPPAPLWSLTPGFLYPRVPAEDPTSRSPDSFVPLGPSPRDGAFPVPPEVLRGRPVRRTLIGHKRSVDDTQVPTQGAPPSTGPSLRNRTLSGDPPSDTRDCREGRGRGRRSTV